MVPSRPIRAVLFDKDGTLIDFRRTWLAAYRGAAAELAARAGAGEALAGALLGRHGYDARHDRFAASSPLLWATNLDIAALWQAEPELTAVDVQPVVERHFSDSKTYPPVAVTDLGALFDGLRGRGVALGLATMDSTQAARRMLCLFGVADRLDFVAGADAGHGLKPGPGMVRAFCAALGVAAAEVAVVGDNLADLAMARAAGAGLAVAVLTGGCPAEALAAEADLVLASVAELDAALGPRLGG